jgi:hypothetical protein
MPAADPVLDKIAALFRGLEVVRSRGGYTLHDRHSGRPVARLKPIPQSDRFELFYWSLVRERWRTFGNFGRLKLTLERTQEIVENEAIFHISNS